MIYTIYKITNTLNEKVYIGYTQRSPFKRWQQHQTVARQNKLQYRLYQAMREDGVHNFIFEILYQTLDRKHALLEMEPFFIKEYDSVECGYNANYAGKDCNTVEQRLKNSLRMRINNPMKGRISSGSFKPGRVQQFSDERRLNHSLAKRGSKNPNFQKRGNAERLNKRVYCKVCDKHMNLGNFVRWHSTH